MSLEYCTELNLFSNKGLSSMSVIKHGKSTIVEHDGEYFVKVDRKGEEGELIQYGKEGRIARIVSNRGLVTGMRLTFQSTADTTEHKVLEPIAEHYTEVKRVAEPGDLVRTTGSSCFESGLLYVAEPGDWEARIDGMYCAQSEYVVLEPKEAEPEEKTDDLLDVIASLTRRVHMLEQDANNFRHDLKTFGAQCEENTQRLKASEGVSPHYFSPFQADLLALCHSHQIPRDLALDLVEAAEKTESKQIDRAIRAAEGRSYE